MGFLDRMRGRGQVKDVGGGKIQVDAVLLRGGQTVEAVGESHYQEALSQVCGGKTPDGHQHLCVAALVPEPDNPYDANAVGVHVDSLKVAHLSREDAAAYQPVLARLAAKRMVGACNAMIVGGWNRGGGDEGHFGIRLDLAPPQWAHPDDPEPPPPPPPTSAPGSATEQSRVRTGQSSSPHLDVGKVRGKHYTDWTETVKDLKRLGHLEQASDLLEELCAAAEDESDEAQQTLPPWYFEQQAIVLRKLKDYDGEVEVLRRYAASPWAIPGEFDERLTKAIEKADRHRDEQHAKGETF